jgi:hypothetical protein
VTAALNGGGCEITVMSKGSVDIVGDVVTNILVTIMLRYNTTSIKLPGY